MASVTIRNLDDSHKPRLCVRAAEMSVVSELTRPTPEPAVIAWLSRQVSAGL